MTIQTQIQHRITSLERWGMRMHADFQAEGVACIRDAGFTGVLVNGGSGIGPDMLPPESLVESPVIPDLMPGRRDSFGCKLGGNIQRHRRRNIGAMDAR